MLTSSKTKRDVNFEIDGSAPGCLEPAPLRDASQQPGHVQRMSESALILLVASRNSRVRDRGYTDRARTSVGSLLLLLLLSGAGFEEQCEEHQMSEQVTPSTDGRRAISDAVTRIHHAHYGAGANGVKTIFEGDHVVIFRDDVYTPAERILLDAGDQETVTRTRVACQAAMKDEFIRIVEEATGREVIAFLSQVNINPDFSTEAYVLDGTVIGGEH
jgi:uncharacterized protein YbcI